MKEEGRLIRLPLACSESPLNSGVNHNFCWDGRFLWVASPDQEPTPSSSASLATPGQERFLAVIDPRSGQIAKFTAADGLPPMQMFGGAAVAALGPGKAVVAGHFGRSWCVIATFSPEKGRTLDVFFEAREAREPNHDEPGKPRQWPFPSAVSARSTRRPPTPPRPGNGCYSAGAGVFRRS